MFEISGDSLAAHVGQSFSNTDALGAHFFSEQDRFNTRLNYTALTWNHLLKRWNLPDSQANIYTWIGPALEQQSSTTHGGGIIGYEADWESRRYYGMNEGQLIFTPEGENFGTETVKVGIAPYLANFDDLTTFILYRAKYKDIGSREEWEFSPAVRLFYGSLFTEIGISHDGKVSGLLMAQIYF